MAVPTGFEPVLPP